MDRSFSSTCSSITNGAEEIPRNEYYYQNYLSTNRRLPFQIKDFDQSAEFEELRIKFLKNIAYLDDLHQKTLLKLKYC